LASDVCQKFKALINLLAKEEAKHHVINIALDRPGAFWIISMSNAVYPDD